MAPRVYCLQQTARLNPTSLATQTRGQLNDIAPPAVVGRVLLLWKAARLPPANPFPQATHRALITHRNGLYAALRGPNVESTAFGRNYTARRNALGVDASCDGIGPASKARRLADTATDTRPLTRFSGAGAHLNILHQVRPSLPSVADGAQGYRAFCYISNTLHSHPQQPWSYVGAPSSPADVPSRSMSSTWRRHAASLVSTPTGIRRPLRPARGTGPTCPTQVIDQVTSCRLGRLNDSLLPNRLCLNCGA